MPPENRSTTLPNFSNGTLDDLNYGRIPGEEPWFHVSRDRNIGPVIADLWGGTGNLSFPTVAESWEVVSTSTDDDLGGTGLEKVVIQYLDINYVEGAVEVEMNGTTAVTLPGGVIYFRSNSFVGSQFGTAGQNGLAAGKVTLQVAGGGNERSVIVAGCISDFDSHYTVPAGKSLAITSNQVYVPKGEDVQTIARFTIGAGGVFFEAGSVSNYQASTLTPLESYLILPEKSEFFYQASSTNTDIDTTIIAQGRIRSTPNVPFPNMGNIF